MKIEIKSYIADYLQTAEMFYNSGIKTLYQTANKFYNHF